MDIVLNNYEWIVGHTFVLTGGFSDEELSEIASTMETLGAVLRKIVTVDTEYVIWQPRMFGVTKKLRMAQAYNGQGSSIVILTQDELLDKLAGEIVVPSTQQKTSAFGAIAPAVARSNPEKIVDYVNEHGLTDFESQEILAALLAEYRKYSFKSQTLWCEEIRKTKGLKYELYEAAVLYYSRSGDYDIADELCDFAKQSLKETKDPNRKKIADILAKNAYYREHPYWPNSRNMKLELAEIYDGKGIPHPSIEYLLESDPDAETEGEKRERTSKPKALKESKPDTRKVPEDKLIELRNAIDAIDYTDDNDGKYSNFVSPQVYNIVGLGDQTIEVLLDGGWVTCFGDIFRLKEHQKEISSTGIITERKLEKILDSIENARTVSDVNFLAGLRIPRLTETVARALLENCKLSELLEKCEYHNDLYSLTAFKGVTPFLSAEILMWFEKEENVSILHDLLQEVTITESAETNTGHRCEGLLFVVTGDVHVFKNRTALKNYIFSEGGNFSDSGVTAATSYLINNDIESTSSKNKKAQKLGIPIITEDEFVEKFGFNS